MNAIPRQFKYIILDNYSPIIFRDSLQHSEVAGHIKDRVTSAGFGQIIPEGESVRVVVMGESMSLNKSSKDIDAKLIERMIQEVLS